MPGVTVEPIRPWAGRAVGGATYAVASGPLFASTCLDLVPYRPVVWDTNGYYRALGIKPDATRREIREAYQRLDGQDSARLTYIVKQLLDREVRAKYDATPLGAFFYDYEVETWIRAARAHEVSRLRAEGRVAEAEEVEAEDYGVLLDILRASGDDDPASPVRPERQAGPVWPWGFYLRASRFLYDATDVDRLDQWQKLLVSTLGKWGERVHVAVGFSGDMESPWGVEVTGQHVVVFLHDDHRPTEVLAERAASRVVRHLHPVLRGPEQHGEKVMSFRKGAEAAKEASKGANFARTQFFNLEDGKSAILRFLMEPDEMIVVDQHQMIPTKKQRPADWPKDAKFPEKMGAVCRRDPAFEYGECYICDNIVDGKKIKRPSARNWLLACHREEVREDGKIVGYRDKTREVTIPAKDGQPEKTVTEKDIVVVNMGYKNFFSILQGFAGRYHTLLDRDYFIKRDGDDTSTTYQIVPCDPLPAKHPESGETEVFDLRQSYFMDRYKSDLNLEEVIRERASDVFYAKFFDPRFTVVDDKVVPANGAEAQQARASAEKGTSGTSEGSSDDEGGVVAPERMSALAARVKGYGASAGETQPEGAEPASSGGMRDFS